VTQQDALNLQEENRKLKEVVEYAASYYHLEILKQEPNDGQRFNNLLLDAIRRKAKKALEVK
jgi:hypothetical protein